MKKTKFIQLIIVISAVFCIVFVSNTKAEQESIDDMATIVEYKKQANNILKNEIIPNISIKAYKNNQELIEKSENGEVLVKSVSYAGLSDFNNTEHVFINFSGTEVSPQTPVMINIKSVSNGTEKVIVDEQGEWTLNIPINSLSAGTNLAYVQTEKQGVKSDEVAIASFSVSSDNKISNKTWYFITFVTLAIIVLLFAVILQLRRNARDLEPGCLI